MLKYSYPSLLACLQDSTPKCTATSIGASIVEKTDTKTATYLSPFVTANTYCNGITDVTPTFTCFSDPTVGYNQMYTFSAPDSDDDNLSGGAIAGIVIGVVVFAILVCILLYLVFKCIKGDGQSGLNTSILGYQKLYLYNIYISYLLTDWL